MWNGELEIHFLPIAVNFACRYKDNKKDTSRQSSKRWKKHENLLILEKIQVMKKILPDPPTAYSLPFKAATATLRLGQLIGATLSHSSTVGL